MFWSWRPLRTVQLFKCWSVTSLIVRLLISALWRTLMRKDGLCAHPRVREGVTLQPEPQHPRVREGITLSLMGTPRCDVEPRSAEGEAPIGTLMKHRRSGRSPALYRRNVHRPELKMSVLLRERDPVPRWSPGGAPVHRGGSAVCVCDVTL